MNDLKKAIICDLDGTLSFANGRDWYDASTCDEDKLNKPIADIVYWAYNAGHVIIFLSGRESKYSEPTIKFLEKHGFYCRDGKVLSGYRLIMRKTGDFRKDSIIKRELYEEHVKDKYNVRFVLDDRQQVVDMWRLAFGLTVLQVAEGKF